MKFFISLISYFLKEFVSFSFLFFKKFQSMICVHTHVILFGFGLCFSNLHVNVYHVLDVDFE